MKKIPAIKYDSEKHNMFAKRNCKKCHGRGFIGFNRTTQDNQPCTCLYCLEKDERKDTA